MYFAAKHLELNLTKQLENGCEGAIKFLTSPGSWDPKRDVVCGAVVDSVLDALPISESLKQWVDSDWIQLMLFIVKVGNRQVEH